MNNDKKEPNTGHRLLEIVFGIAAIVSWIMYWHLPKEKRATITHMLSDRLHRTSQHIVEYLIPHERNGYKPKVFQARSVKNILLLVVFIKVVLVTTLFAIYPNLGTLESDITNQMYALINQYRTESGVKPLAIDVNLASAAELKGIDMLAQNYFSHYGPDGKKPWQWLDPATYDFKAMGENLGMDFLSANSVFRAFQQSPTHNKNLINTAYNDIGISVQNGQLEGHTTNIIVVFFGTRKESTAALAQAPLAVNTVSKSEPTNPVQVVVQPKLTQPEPTDRTPEVNEPAATSTAVAQNNPTRQASGTNPPIGIRPVAEAQPEIMVLGEAVANDGSPVTENFTSGVVLSQGTWLQRLVSWSDRFLMLFLMTLVILLAVNIIVKIRVQHAHIIANALMLIIVVAGALYLHVHTVEAIGEQVKILSALFIR